MTNTSCTVRMCCYSPNLTLKGNICSLEMTIGRLMITLLPVHLCCAMVPPGKARVFTKHKQVIILALCPTWIGVAGVNMVLVPIEELLLSDNRSYCVVCSDLVRSKGRRQKKYRSQCWVGLCAVPCNERYHTLKNYKRSPRYLIGQIAVNWSKSRHMYFTMAQ